MISTENLRGKSGVYCAIHRDSLKCYVGSSVNMHGRRMDHLKQSRWGSYPTLFHRSLRKLGPESFDFEVLEFCNRDQLAERESFWIKFYQSAGVKGFNTLSTAYVSPTIEHAEATRARMREAKQNISEETRRRMSESQKRKAPPTQEARARMSEAQKRRGPVTEETRLKLSEAWKRRSPITEAQRERVRAGARNRAKPSEETKARISAGLKAAFGAKGPMPQETRDKIRKSLLARNASLE